MLRNKKTVKQHHPAKKAAVKKAPVKKAVKRSFASNCIHGADTDNVIKATTYPLTRQTTLANGLRFATEAKDTNLATVGVFVHAGSRFENDQNNGVTNFLHRVLFKGKKTALEAQIDKLGGHIKAHTGREVSYITATVTADKTEEAIKLLGDVFTNARFTEADVDAEREAVLNQLLASEEDVNTAVMNKLHYSAFRGSSLALNPLGNPKTIAKLTKNDLESYFKSHYTGDRMVFGAVGPTAHSKLAPIVEASFSNVPAESATGIKPKAGITNFTGSDIRLRDDDMTDAHMAVAYEIPGWSDADNYPFQAFKHMIGNYDSARAGIHRYASSDLVSNCATHAIGESIAPFVQSYSDVGLFGIYAVAAPNNVDLISDDIVMATIRPTFNVPADYLDEAKVHLHTTMMKDYEGSEKALTSMGQQILQHNRRIHPIEVMQRINSITQGDVQRIAKKYTYDQEFVFSSMGHIFELQEYVFLRKKNTAGWY